MHIFPRRVSRGYLIVYDFYTNLNEFYGVIAECCTQQNCPTMSAGLTYVLPKMCYGANLTTVHRLNYTWTNQDRKSVHLPASTYIDYVMTWVQNLLDDENSFPTKAGMSQEPCNDYVLG